MPMRSALRGRLLSGFSVREEREDYTHFRHLWVIQSVCVCVCVCVSVSVCVLVSVSVRVCVCVSDHVNVFVKNTVCDRDACGAQGPEYYSQNRLPVILPLLLDPVLSRARPHAHARALSHFLVLALSSLLLQFDLSFCPSLSFTPSPPLPASLPRSRAFTQAHTHLAGCNLTPPTASHPPILPQQPPRLVFVRYRRLRVPYPGLPSSHTLPSRLPFPPNRGAYRVQAMAVI